MNITGRHGSSHSGSASAQVWDRPFYQDHQKWCDDFVVELRLMGASGDVIGDRLAEVETHCAESGELPQEAFGDAAAYGRSVGAESSKVSGEGVWMSAALSVGQVLALLVGTRAAGAWATGVAVEYNAVQVACLILAVVVLVALPLAIRFIIHRPLLAGLPYFALFMTLVMGAALAQRLDLPALVTAPSSWLTVGLFALIVALSWLSMRNLSNSRDDLTSPLAVSDDLPAARNTVDKANRSVAVYLAVVFPVAYVLLSVVSWLTA